MERVRLPRKRKTRRAANRKALTEVNVAKLRPDRTKQYSVWDSGTDAVRGLSVLVSPAGARSYRSTYYFPDSPKPHSRHLGRVGEMTLTKARELCKADRKNSRDGIDPKGNKPGASDSFLSVVEDYIRLEQIAALGRVSAPGVRMTLLRNTTQWHARPVALIKALQIQALLQTVRDGDEAEGIKPRRHLSVALHRQLSGFFKWCVAPGIEKVKSSPMVGIKVPWKGAEPRSRPWFKGDAGNEAIKKIWLGADKLDDPTEGAYLKMLLLLGKRKTALAKMRWENIQPNWFWDAPKAQTLYKRLHGVPLPPAARHILGGKRKTSGFVFPGNENGHIHISGNALYTAVRRATGIDDFFFHGVRHLVETKMAELKVLPHIRDMVLDHNTKRGGGAGYDHHDYPEEKLAALNKWANHVKKVSKA